MTSCERLLKVLSGPLPAARLKTTNTREELGFGFTATAESETYCLQS